MSDPSSRKSESYNPKIEEHNLRITQINVYAFHDSLHNKMITNLRG